jgi:hypothetical protein
MLIDSLIKLLMQVQPVVMPMMDMSWGDRYGQLVDPFGHFWSVATHKQDLIPEQIEKAGELVLKEMMMNYNKDRRKT